MSRAPCVGVLLAGGAARRFGGRPKGLARVDGTRIADRVLAALVAATDDQFVIANDERAARWFPGHRIAPDTLAGAGPLGGVLAALEAARGAAIVVVAWDMPFVSGSLLLAMRDLAEAEAAHAVVPVHGERGVAEPLCAFYAPRALDVCRSLLARGERRASALYESLPAVRTLQGEALRAFGDPARLFTSVDSPEALAALGGSPDPLEG